MLIICELNLIIVNGFEIARNWAIFEYKHNFMVGSPPKMLEIVLWVQIEENIFFLSDTDGERVVPYAAEASYGP